MSIRSKPASKEYKDGWDRIFTAQQLMCPICEGTGDADCWMSANEPSRIIKCPVCKGTGRNTKT